MIRCRARVSRACLNGEPEERQFGEDLPLSEDGTFVSDVEGGSIICDPCYIRLMPLTPSGRGLLWELPEALGEAVRMGWQT